MKTKMTQPKAQNDPWSPLPSQTNGLEQPPADPLHQLIDSARYIDSLEKKLMRIQGKSKPEPSSKDMIKTLSSFHQDQMCRFVDADSSKPAVSTFCDQDSGSAVSASYLQRRLRPDKQAINEEELFELLKDDQLERNRQEREEEDGEEQKEEGRNARLVLPEQGREKEEEKELGSLSNTTSNTGLCGDVLTTEKNNSPVSTTTKNNTVSSESDSSKHDKTVPVATAQSSSKDENGDTVGDSAA